MTSLRYLFVAAVIAAPVAVAQQSGALRSTTSPQQTSAYEVATVKPAQANEFAPALRVYIQGAFGIPVNSIGWVIGPDWINAAKYVIRGKPSESMNEAMQAMSPAERTKLRETMQQGLLAERFNLKAHFETREMPVYKLVLAKGGSKLKENPDTAKGRLAANATQIRGIAVPIRNLLDALESVPDLGGRVVIDETRLAGTYDLLLRWTPMDAAPPQGGPSGTSSSSSAEAVSLFIAIEEQLGLKLVPAKQPGQILIIDHIERPSEN